MNGSCRITTRLQGIGFAILAIALGSKEAPAAESETLQRIAATETIRLGHRESSVPFSYYDGRKQVVGYAQDIMLGVVSELRRELQLPGLTIALVPVTPQNRIPLLINGAIDLECGSTTHNREREKKVAFSNTIFIASIRLLTRSDSQIHDFADLAGKQVVVTAGTTAERLLRRRQDEDGLATTIFAARDHDKAFQQLEQGHAAAFVMDDALLFGRRARAAHPEQWSVTGEALSSEAYACAMRKNDPQFKKLVDDAIAKLMKSGAAQEIYAKWFTRPIPPDGINLDWPMPPRLLELFAAPNDRPLD